MHHIRNFAIIAHIDHGKSTLADRLMELTGIVEKGLHVEQFLDRNPISRERGITIKLAPVRMLYKNSIRRIGGRSSEQIQNPSDQNSKRFGFRDSDFGFSDSEFILNLIDTPGHVDFSYEVDRTLACVEGVILLVDATQGIQAQTIANAYKAIEKDLVIIPVVNKIDLPNADVEKTKQELVDFLGIEKQEIIGVSAKTGENVEKVLERIIRDIPAPTDTKHHIDSGLASIRRSGSESGMTKDVLQALIFDSYFDLHKGVIAFVRLFNGEIIKGQPLRLAVGGISFESLEVGIFTPDLRPVDRLASGEIGYIATNLKNIHRVRVGDTVTDKKGSPLSGYKTVLPMVFASLFTTDPGDYENLKNALEKIYLTDSALSFTPLYSKALGAGFRVGFLGLLHADVVRERLEREYNLNLIITPPKVDYRILDDTKYEEPMVRISIMTPNEYLGAVMRVCENHRATFLTMDNKNQIAIEYEMPLSEMIADFFDQLKSVTSGYASFSWEFTRFQPVDADKLSILLNGDPIEEFSEIVVPERAQEKARTMTQKMRTLIPRQQFEVRIQAQYKGRIIASERIAPFRKDVLVKGSKVVGAGDVTRKRKLLEKQKKGKKKMKMIGKVEIPKEAFMGLFRK